MKGRFAPSPTGTLHVGNLRTALLAWLFARSDGARFLVRMEDLDRVTSSVAHEHEQLADLTALGLDWDGEVIRQSERFDRYRRAIDELTDAGLTYPCYCSRREIREAASAPHATTAAGSAPEGAYPGTCRDLTDVQRAERLAGGRPAAIRLRTGHERVTFRDRLRGEVTGIADDVVLSRNDGVPAYHLAVVVDDAAQGVTEVVRGDDLLSSTPSQIHLAHLLRLPVPVYAHVPLVLGPDGQRLAKRHGAVTLGDLAAQGVDRHAVRAMLAASLCLCEPNERPGLAELLQRFDPADLPDQPWTFTG